MWPQTGQSGRVRLVLVSRCPFLWYRGGLSLLFGIEISFFGVDSAFCCSTSRSSSSWDQPVRALSASTSCKLEVKKDLDTEKKINKSRYPNKDISIPSKRVTRTGRPPNTPSLRNFGCRFFESFEMSWIDSSYLLDRQEEYERLLAAQKGGQHPRICHPKPTSSFSDIFLTGSFCQKKHAFARVTPAIFIIFLVFTWSERQSPCFTG